MTVIPAQGRICQCLSHTPEHAVCSALGHLHPGSAQTQNRTAHSVTVTKDLFASAPRFPSHLSHRPPTLTTFSTKPHEAGTCVCEIIEVVYGTDSAQISHLAAQQA